MILLLPLIVIWLVLHEVISQTTIGGARLEDEDLTLFSDALARVVTFSDIRELVTSSNNTIFAPTNDAFAKAFPQQYLTALFQRGGWILHLQNLIESHIAAIPLDFSGLQNEQEVTMWNGEIVTILVEQVGSVAYAQSQYGNGTAALITGTGTTSAGATLFKLDFFLQPAFFGIDILQLGSLHPQFSIISGMLESTSLFDDGPGMLTEGFYVTVFAPTDEAILEKYGENGVQLLLESADRAYIQKFLLNHVVLGVYPTVLMETGEVLSTLGGSQLTVTKLLGDDGSNSTVMLGQASVLMENVLARNGLAHGVDQVLGNLPLFVSAPTSSQGPPSAPSAISPAPTPSPSSESIVQSDPDLSVFWKDLKVSGAYQQINDTAFTAFAPINAAFEGFDLMETLRSPSWIAHYRHFMLFHVVVGDLSSSLDTYVGTPIETLSGESITVSLDGAFGNDTTLYLSGPLNQNVTILESYSEEVTQSAYHKISDVLLPLFVGTDLLALSDQLNNFGILADLLEMLGEIPGFFLDGTYTIFAPTDDAFLALDEDEFARLNDAENVAELQALLLAHIFIGVFPSELFVSGTSIASLGGSKIDVGVDLQFYDGAGVSRIIVPDVLANNGIAHGIDRVLGRPGGVSSLAERLRLEPDIKIFASALFESGLNAEELIEQGTVFAPIDSAFTSLGEDFLTLLFTPQWIAHLQSFLAFHILSGSALAPQQLALDASFTMANGDNITVDVDDEENVSLCSAVSQCSQIETPLVSPDGVIYKIESVLLPFWLNAGIDSLDATTENATIFRDLISIAGFTREDPGPVGPSVFTILIPSDSAFMALGSETLEYLKNPANKEELIALISNHLFNQVYPSQVLSDGDMLITLGDLGVAVTTSTDGLFFNRARLETANILFRDGIGHVIDRVLGQPETAPPAAAVTFPTRPPSGSQTSFSRTASCFSMFCRQLQVFFAGLAIAITL